MREYLVLLGSNIDAQTNISLAIEMLASHPDLTLEAVSGVYESPAVVASGEVDLSRNPYQNAAVLLKTKLDRVALRSELREFESALGRVRREDKYADRSIDLDIVGLRDPGGSCEIDPIVYEQEFAALPVAEIAHSWPATPDGRSLGEVTRQMNDTKTRIQRIL